MTSSMRHVCAQRSPSPVPSITDVSMSPCIVYLSCGRRRRYVVSVPFSVRRGVGNERHAEDGPANDARANRIEPTQRTRWGARRVSRVPRKKAAARGDGRRRGIVRSDPQRTRGGGNARREECGVAEKEKYEIGTGGRFPARSVVDRTPNAAVQKQCVSAEVERPSRRTAAPPKCPHTR